MTRSERRLYQAGAVKEVRKFLTDVHAYSRLANRWLSDPPPSEQRSPGDAATVPQVYGTGGDEP
jgi:hypothetical protein